MEVASRNARAACVLFARCRVLVPSFAGWRPGEVLRGCRIADGVMVPCARYPCWHSACGILQSGDPRAPLLAIQIARPKAPDDVLDRGSPSGAFVATPWPVGRSRDLRRSEGQIRQNSQTRPRGLPGRMRSLGIPAGARMHLKSRDEDADAGAGTCFNRAG